MRKKIVMIVNDIWPNSDEMWGIKKFQQEGYHVEIWRLGKLTIGTTIWVVPAFKADMVTLKSWKQFYNILFRQNFRKTIFLFMGFNKAYSKAYNKVKFLINCFGGKYCNISYTQPLCREAIEHYDEVKKRQYSFMDLFPSTYNFLACELSKGNLNSRYDCERKANIILHSGNYDKYILTERKGDTISDTDYILFMDQNLLDHKDQVNYGIKKWIKNRERYVGEINRFLDYLETLYKCQVIVAAHPTADYKNDELYKGKKIVYGQSALYVKFAKMVVVFMSLSVEFAVLYKKPVLFYYGDELKKSYLFRDFLVPRLKEVKGKAINISNLDSYESIDEYVVSADNMQSCMKDITSGKTKNLFFEEVVRYINEINKKR